MYLYQNIREIDSKQWAQVYVGILNGTMLFTGYNSEGKDIPVFMAVCLFLDVRDCIYYLYSYKL